MRGTQSPGITLLLWVVGAVYALAASYLYLELGLHIPRFVIDGEEMGVPRSGGELNYVRVVNTQVFRRYSNYPLAAVYLRQPRASHVPPSHHVWRAFHHLC